MCLYNTVYFALYTSFPSNMVHNTFVLFTASGVMLSTSLSINIISAYFPGSREPILFSIINALAALIVYAYNMSIRGMHWLESSTPFEPNLVSAVYIASKGLSAAHIPVACPAYRCPGLQQWTGRVLPFINRWIDIRFKNIDGSKISICPKQL